MAGVYGSINSRSDFFAALASARSTASQLLSVTPQDLTLLSIQLQLEAIDGWTRGNSEPPLDERMTLDMGRRAARELADTGDPVIEAFNELIFTLSAYVKDWPSDAEAAGAKDTDPVFLRRPPRP